MSSAIMQSYLLIFSMFGRDFVISLAPCLTNMVSVGTTVWSSKFEIFCMAYDTAISQQLVVSCIICSVVLLL
jgi:hypothetical protein